MHKPLSHAKAQHHPPNASFLTSIHQRADSLAFSLTSEKHTSPHSSRKIIPSYSQSKQDTLNFQLQYLQRKKKPSSGKLKKTQHQHNKTAKSITKLTQQSTLEYFNCKRQQPKDKENNHMQNRIGKIVHRQASSINGKLMKARYHYKEKPIIYSALNKNSIPSENIQKMIKSKEMNRLSRQLQTAKQSLQKSERSRSQCNQELSATKGVLRQLKEDEKKQERIIKALQFQLRRSQTIRYKQKNIILRQREQIEKCRQVKKNGMMR